MSEATSAPTATAPSRVRPVEVLPIVAIVGATATGKSELALDLAHLGHEKRKEFRQPIRHAARRYLAGVFRHTCADCIGHLADPDELLRSREAFAADRVGGSFERADMRDLEVIGDMADRGLRQPAAGPFLRAPQERNDR